MKLFSWLFYLFLLICISIASFLYFALEQKPLVIETEQFNTQSAIASQNLLKNSVKDILNSKQTIELKANTDELNSLVAISSRAINNLQARVNISAIALIGAFSYKLPLEQLPLEKLPFNINKMYYLNIKLQINPSVSGLDIESASFGDITISGTLFTNIVVSALDYFLKDQQGSLFIKSIQGVSLTNEHITLRLKPPHNLNSQISKTTSQLKQYRDDLQLLGDPLKVRGYYQYLMSLKSVEHQSLSYYLASLFQHAAKNSSNKFNAVIENKAALLAVGIYLGNPSFETLIGSVRTEQMKLHQPPSHITLANRDDLRLHFIYSAIIKLASDLNISAAIGEYKEFLDSSKGGSGFSFDDLAADMAGVRLAEMATDHNSAFKLQKLLSNKTTETSFFPEIRDLPSGLSQHEFELRFGSVEDERYKKMVKKINQRLNKLELYNEG